MAKQQPRKHQRTKAQHFVPQMLLRGFTNVSGRLFCFDKATGRSYQTKIRGAAQESDFYEIPSTQDVQVPHNMVENALADMEGKWAPLLADVIRGSDAGGISRALQVALAPFVVIQWMRTPTFRAVGYELMKQFGQSLIDQLVELNFPDMAGIANPIFCLDFEAMAGVHAGKLFEQDKVEKMAMDLLRHIWIVGINDTEHAFYTSDHPVVRRGNLEADGRRLIGANDPGVEFVFPLDTRHILLILEQTYFADCARFDGRAIPLPPEGVSDYNKLQVMRSNQRIYCANEDFDLAREVCAAHPEICDPKRPRVRIESTPVVDMKSETWVTVLE